MSFQVRTARPDDVPEIARWTAGIFDWGDYVAERMPDWLESPESLVAVAVDDGDLPIGICHTTLLSATEAWLEAARVHPDHRREGIGSALNRAGTTWARESGARIARLATEVSNTSAQAQVEALGYRNTTNWVATRLESRSADLDDDRLLRPANPADIDPAWMSWAVSDLAAAGRELISHGWRWRNARITDLGDAAAEYRLLQCPFGWVIVEQPEPNLLRIGWLSTTPEDAPSMVEAILNFAHRREVETVRFFVPKVPWMVESLTRSGGEPTEVLIYAMAL